MIVPERCCFCMSLRTGVILLGIVQLTASIFSLFLLIFGLSFLNDLNDMLEADVRANPYSNPRVSTAAAVPVPVANDYEEVESIADPSYDSNNNNRAMNMHAANLINMDKHIMYTCVFIVSIQVLCCGTLLYGAIKRQSHYLKPWLAMVTVGTICDVIAFIIYMFIYGLVLRVIVFEVLGLIFVLYVWQCVFSLYHQLLQDENQWEHCRLNSNNASEWKGYAPGVNCPYKV